MAARCRSCAATIRYVKTPAGRTMPLDVEPAPDGNVRVAFVGGLEVGLVLADPAELAAARIDGPLYLSHFATCPDAGRWRRKD